VSKSEDKERFRATCLQFHVESGEVESNLATVQTGAAEAGADGAELLVLPELWTTSFLKEPSPEIAERSARAEDAVLEMSGDLGVVVIGSAIEMDDGGSGPPRYFNRARVFDHGREVGSYRKVHLFSPNAEHRIHHPGEHPLVVDTSVGRMGVLVCYDLRFPELVRYYFYKGVEMLVVPAQWPEARSTHWRTLVRARAIENEVFVIGCNRTGQEHSLKTGEVLPFPGDSRIVDPMGEVLASGSGEQGTVSAEIDLRKTRTMRRLLPVMKDQRPEVYRHLWRDAWEAMVENSRDGAT